ncbi:MAG TPA: hypothetical protein VGI81_12215 [Tepidisphaeraceae bacterium]|jgi:hypothetical protein
MAVAVAELEKPYFAKCRYQTGTGCSIYPDRPQGCRQYTCAWLQGMLADDMRPDKSGFILSPEAGGLYVYIVRDQPIEPLLTKLAAFNFATSVHGVIGTEQTPIWVYLRGQRVATPFDNNPDNQGKPLAERATLYSSSKVQFGGKWFAIANGPWRPVLEVDQTRADGRQTGDTPAVSRAAPSLPPHAGTERRK